MGFPFSDHVTCWSSSLPAASRSSMPRAPVIRRTGKSQRAERRSRIHSRDLQRLFLRIARFRGIFPVFRGSWTAAHLADGFEPARQDGYSRDLDPVELVLRACHHWDSTRWPGTNGRLVYTQSLYAVFMLRQLEQLSLRIWDDGQRTQVGGTSIVSTCNAFSTC